MNEELIMNEENIIEETEPAELMELTDESEPEIQDTEDDRSKTAAAAVLLGLSLGAAYGGYCFTKNKVVPTVKRGLNWAKSKMPIGKKNEAEIVNQDGEVVGKTSYKESDPDDFDDEYFDDDPE